jgi:hypothetical protein
VVCLLDFSAIVPITDIATRWPVGFTAGSAYTDSVFSRKPYVCQSDLAI